MCWGNEECMLMNRDEITITTIFGSGEALLSVGEALALADIVVILNRRATIGAFAS